MAFAPLIFSGAGLAISYFGGRSAANQQERAGEAQRRAAEKQADIMDFNAQVADVQARDAIERGAQDESRFRQGVRLMIGEQRANIAAGNIDVGYGSAVDVQADAAYLGELDAHTIRQNAQREAWGFRVQATDLRKRARVARQEGVVLAEAGRAAASATRIGALSNVLTGTGSLLAARYGFGGGGEG